MSSDIIVYDASKAMEQAKHKAEIVKQLRSSSLMVSGKDYGTIPGAGKKPTLLKPGAERLCSAFGLSPRFVDVSRIERFEPDNALFQYEFECVLTHIESGKEVARANGSCNSMESKYRWRWAHQNEVAQMGLDVATLKKNKYNKYRVPNDDIFSQVNTILKMAQKRALVAAVLIATNASEHFTQDIEDLPDFGDVIEAEYEEVKEPAFTKEKIEELFDRVRTGLANNPDMPNDEIFNLVCWEDGISPFNLEWWSANFESINAAALEFKKVWPEYEALQNSKESKTESALEGLDPDFDEQLKSEQPALLDAAPDSIDSYDMS